jgi:hypothetical protein
MLHAHTKRYFWRIGDPDKNFLNFLVGNDQFRLHVKVRCQNVLALSQVIFSSLFFAIHSNSLPPDDEQNCFFPFEHLFPKPGIFLNDYYTTNLIFDLTYNRTYKGTLNNGFMITFDRKRKYLEVSFYFKFKVFFRYGQIENVKTTPRN